MTRFSIEHVQLRISGNFSEGHFFALIAGDDSAPKPSDILFSGPIGPGMPSELRAIADHIDNLLEAKNAD